MNTLRLELALLALAVSLAALGPRRVRQAVTASATPAPVVARAAALPAVDDPDSLDAARRMIVDNDPFRLVNRPASVAFTLAPPHGAGDVVVAGRPAVPQPPPPPPRPALVLRAIMGGPPWIAVVDGLPGRGAGAMVREGDMFERITVFSVGRDTVVVQAPDTTWRLTLPRVRQ